MWLLTFLLIPVVLGASSESTIDNFFIKIENDILMRVQTTERSSNELNLMGLGLRGIEIGAFNDLTDVKILNLGNNSLSQLHQAVFSNLTSLEHLSLVNNNIKGFSNAFVGLDNLKTLNISNNPLKSLGPGEFYGLGSSVDIFVLRNSLQEIRRNLFDEPSTESLRKRRTSTRIKRSMVHRPGQFPKSSFRVKACVEHGVLKLVDILRDNENLTSDCTEILSENNDRVFIENLNITSVARGWYRIQRESLRAIWMVSFVNNSIVQLTRGLLNNLPKDVIHVDLSRNKIERLEKGIISNPYIRALWITENSISEIENGTFQRTKLEDLDVSDNLMTDLKFVDTLPPSIKVICVERNRLTEIPDGSFSKVEKLDWLRLDGNLITELRMDALRGITHLYTFGLSDNPLKKIELGSFRNVKQLSDVYLRNISLAKLEKGLFDGPPYCRTLDLSMNKFTNVKEQIRDGLPNDLQNLFLDNNEIESLEAGSFARVPTNELRLRGNKISKIAKGTFDMERLSLLDLGNNSLSHVDGELFEGVGYSNTVLLDGNGITNIEKGFAKHLWSMYVLDISRNPIRRLENGALFGMAKEGYSHRVIRTSQTPIEVIQGGLFKDV